jgi:hypothetical protein
MACPDGVAPLELAHETRRCHLGQAARQQEVPGVATRDVHNLASEAEALDILTENNLHG